MRTWPALDLAGLAAPTTLPEATTGDLVQAALTGAGVVAVEERTPDAWRMFFSDGAARDAAATLLANEFPSLDVSAIDVDDEDWAARSQASLTHVRVGRVIVAPPWDRPAVPGTLEVVIQPSMGFGTGHHATTRLCLQALQERALAGARVIDVGTGSGILALAALRLGAASAHGIDDDPDAVQAAQENLDLNPGTPVQFEVADLRRLAGVQYDLALANLTGGLLMATAPRLEALVRPGGHLILSGFMVHEADDVLASFPGCTLVSRTREDEWVCAVLERRS